MSEPKNAMPKPRAGGGVRKTAQQQEFERQHPRSAKGRTGGGQWIQKGAGMTGEPSRDVRHLQDRLTALGYSPGAADGRFGPKTEASVVRFQADYKLRADGQVGPDTTVALRGATPQDAERRRERGLNADLASTGAEYAKESAKEWTKPTPEQLKAEKEAEREAKKERKAKSRRSKASSSRALSKGDGIGSVRGDSQVKQMQQLLDALGYDLGDAGVDGRFGPDTAKAVRKLQRRFGLATDGVFGQQTRRLLTRLAKRTAKKMKTGRADEIATADQNPDLTKGLAEAMSDQQINGLRLPELANLLAGTNAPEYVEEGLTRTLDLLEATRTARLRATGQVAARLLARERVLRRRLEEAEVLSRDRDDLPSSAFVYPRERRYPIHDVDHARRALLRVAESGTEREQLAVREAVEARYPRLDLLEGVVKRGVGRGAVQIRRLPDGTFAPKGLGRVLTPGTKVKMPGTDGKFTHGIVAADGVHVRTFDPKERDYGKSEGPLVKLGKPAPPKNPASKADAEHLRVARQEHREQLAGEKKRRGERKEQLRKIADDRPLNAYTLTGEAKEHLDRYVAEHGRKPGPAGIKRLQELYPEDFKLTAKGVKAQPAAPKNPANGIDAFKKADGPHGPVYEATDPDGTKLRLRRERTGAVVLETDGMPERFTDEKIAQDRFLAAVKGKDARAKEGAKHLNLGDKPKPTREEREAAAAKKHPLGTKVSTTVHSTGGRSEEVEGEVVGHSRGQLEVKTESGHGTIVVPLDKVNGSKPAPPKNPAKRPDPAEKVYDSMGQAELRTELTNVTGALKNPHHDDQTRARLESRRESILSRLTEMPKAKKDERWGTRPVSDKGYVGKSAKKPKPPQSPGDEGLTQKEIDAELKRSEKGMAERYTVSYDKPTSQWKINDSKTGESQLAGARTHAEVSKSVERMNEEAAKPKSDTQSKIAAIKPKPLPKPPQNPGIPGEGGGFKDNSTSLVDLPIGAEFKLKNGDTYRLHKFTDGGGAIGKPVSVSSGSTAAKFFNGKLAPKQVKQPKTPAPAAPKPKKASGAFNGKNLGPSGKERNVKAMTDAKLKQIVDHPDAEPALKERASAELAKRGGGADTESALKDSIDAAKKGSKYDGVLTPDDLADVKPGDELSHEGTVKTAEKVGKAGVKFTDGSIAPAYDLKRPQPEPPKMSKAPLNVKNLGPSGKERNVKAMSDAKLKELSGHPLVEPALKTRVDAELAKRDGSKVTGPRYKPNPKAPGDLSNDELLAEYDKAYNSAQGKNGESGDEAQAAYEHHKKLHTELTKRHGPEKAAQALKLYREAKGDIEGPKEPDSKPGAKAGGTDAVSKAQAALAKKQAEWDALPADASKEERAKKASQLRAAKYRVKKAGGDPAKPSGAPKDAAPKAGASQVGVLKQGSSGGLGKAHTPTGNKTADESKLAQLKADAATAKGNYESAKAGDAVTPAALSKLASNASAWEQKAKVFEKAMGTDAKPTQAQVSKSQYLNNRLAKPGGSITMPDGYKLRRADNADVEVISNSGKKLGSYGNPADALKAYNEFKREVKAGEVALRAFISAFLDGPHGDKADATPGEPKGKAGGDPSKPSSATPKLVSTKPNSPATQAEVAAAAEEAANPKDGKGEVYDFSSLAGQSPSKMVDAATKQTGDRKTAVEQLKKSGLLSSAQADKQLSEEPQPKPPAPAKPKEPQAEETPKFWFSAMTNDKDLKAKYEIAKQTAMGGGAAADEAFLAAHKLHEELKKRGLIG